MKNIITTVSALLITTMPLMLQAVPLPKEGSALQKMLPVKPNKDALLVKSGDKIVIADTLVKDQPLVNSDGKVIAMPTGKLIVKLADGVSAADFSQSYNLRLDWQSDNNLTLLAVPEGVDLLKLLKSLKQHPQVLRAELDLAQDFYQLW